MRLEEILRELGAAPHHVQQDALEILKALGAGWRPTHEITIERHGGQRYACPVALIEGSGYTAQEWLCDDAADWECDDAGCWTFRGRVAPEDNATVSVRCLGSHELADSAGEGGE